MGQPEREGRIAIAIAILVGLLIPAFARSQQAPTPDKSGYSVFDPTPSADLRAFCTDRPSKSASPCTVDAGHLQIETDLLNFTFDHSGGADTTTVLLTNPTVKLGLTNTLDVELNLAPWEILTSRDRASGVTTRLSGPGDLFVRLKFNLLGDDGGGLGLAISPYVKLPTAGAGLGNGAVEGGAVGLFSLGLPHGWSVNVNPEIDMLENARNTARHANASLVISLNRPLSKTLTGTGEVWADRNFDPAGATSQASADVGLAWIPEAHPNFQLDGGANFGLSRSTPATQVYIGASRRF